MSVVSNGQFWIYTIALLIVWIIVLTTAFNNDSNLKNKVSFPNENNEDELKNTNNCKNLCKHCGCLAFYCGEECICECNNEHSDTECIGLIQTNAKKLSIPFEILIQGPTANTFVRKALQFEQNNERRSYGYRNKRSTVTVYKPNTKENHEIDWQHHVHKLKSSSDGKTLIRDVFNVAKKLKDRRKRSSEQFNWFSDLGNNLLRPAPLGIYKRKVQESKTPPAAPKTATISSIFDNSWFSAITPNILTPAPLVKRKKSKIASDIYDENDISLETKTYLLDNNKFINDNHNNQELDTNYSDELKKKNKFNKNSYLPEENPLEQSQETLTDELYSRLFKIDSRDKRFKEDFFLSEEKMAEESQETLTGGLLKNDLENKNEEKDSLLPEGKDRLDDESQETLLTGGIYSRIFKGDLSQTPKKFKKGLNEFRIPWFKPVNFFEKVKRVISP